MQLIDDADLAEALAAARRAVTVLVEFDWHRDGRYSHPYSDLSALVQNVSSDRQITGDLPREVSTTVGYSSAEMNLTLAGTRAGLEMTAEQLFSPYKADSPLYNVTTPGTPVRYSRVVETRSGPRVVRQFTGWVRSFEIDRSDHTVKIVGSDALDMMNAPVTLPTWARQPFSRLNNTWPLRDDAAAMTRPIELGWVVEETLRQSGNPTGPRAHPAAVAYWSMNGSMLPSVGTINDAFVDPIANHMLRWQNVPAFRNGRYGLEPTPSQYPPVQESGWRRNVGMAVSPKAQPLPVDGGPADQVIGFSAWVRTETDEPLPFGPNEASAQRSNYRHLAVKHSFWMINGKITRDGSEIATPHYYVTDTDDNPFVRDIELYIFPDGRFYVCCLEFRETGNPGLKYWATSEAPPSPPGHHYYDIRLHLTNGVPRVFHATIDGVEQRAYQMAPFLRSSWEPLPAEWAKFIPGSNTSGEFLRNFSTVYTSISAQHVQVYLGETSAITDPAVEALHDPLGHPPRRDDRPLAVVPAGSVADCTAIPQTYRRPAWELLQELASAEMSIVHTDEYGTKWFVSNHQVRLERESAARSVGLEISDDRLLGFIVNPTSDQYRNIVTIGYNERWAEYGLLWKPGDWRNWIMEAGTNVVDEVPVEDMISVITGLWLNLGGIEFRQHNLPRGIEVSETAYYNAARMVPVEDSNADLTGANEWAGYILSGWLFRYGASPDGKPAFTQRRFAGGPLPYVDPTTTKYAQAMQPTAKPEVRGGDPSWRINMWVQGWKLGTSETGTVTASNQAEIAARGPQELFLPDNPWRSWKGSAAMHDGAHGIAQSLLADTVTPAPLVDGVSIPSDPRIQLRDVVKLRSEGGVTGSLFAQVIGINRTDDDQGSKDALTLRIVVTPGEWLLGEEGLTELGDTTILG